MSFIAKHIANESERLIYVARLHWIGLLKGLAWFAAFALTGLSVEWEAPFYVDAGRIELFGRDYGSPLLWFRWFMVGSGALIFLAYFIGYFWTEIALTSRRIIFKKGMISTEVEEIDLAEIRGERISHGVLGRFLHYGRLHLDSRFVKDIDLPAIRKPYKFLQAMQRTRAQLHPVTNVHI